MWDRQLRTVLVMRAPEEQSGPPHTPPHTPKSPPLSPYLNHRIHSPFCRSHPPPRSPYTHPSHTHTITTPTTHATDPAVKAFGISIDTKMADVNARVLNPPLLAYGKPEALTPGTRVRAGDIGEVAGAAASRQIDG